MTVFEQGKASATARKGKAAYQYRTQMSTARTPTCAFLSPSAKYTAFRLCDRLRDRYRLACLDIP
jgi:hypothetical protein